MFLTYLKNNFVFSCAACVSFEYFLLETFVFIMNDVISKEQQRQRCLIIDLTYCNEFRWSFLGICFLRTNEYFFTETVELSKRIQSKGLIFRHDPPLPLIFPHVSHRVPPISVGISYVSSIASPCLLF